MPGAIIQRIRVHPLSIPMRCRVEHGAAQRDTSDTIVVAADLFRGPTGFGETLPRVYVTGETRDSVLAAMEGTFLPFLAGFHPESLPDALEAIEALPWVDAQGRCASAARAAIELALLDAVLRFFERDVDAVVRWMGLPGFGSSDHVSGPRFSGVLASDSTETTLRQLRLMWWCRLRHFKLKVGTEGDRERLEQVVRYLGKSLRVGRRSLRVDANGAWTKDQAVEWLSDVAEMPIAAVEQPLARGAETDAVVLNDLFEVPIIHDESLITMEDAHRLIQLGVAGGFNIRISKCGGLIPSLRLAALARRSAVRIQLGCMVGETSILSAAGLRFLEVCPGIEWAEGCFGTYLLSDDVTAKSLRFGCGGRRPRLRAGGLGALVDEAKLGALADDRARVFNL